MSSHLREWTVLSMLEWATDYFAQNKVAEPRLSIEWLLAEILQVDRLDLYLQFDRPLTRDELEALRPLVKRRAGHEPLQYIIGYTNFLKARISVTPDVLIPRSETEQLVEIILENHSNNQALNVLDIGTGSGCIAITLKMERPAWTLHAIDNSSPAVELARKNAAQNEVDINIANGSLDDDLSAAFPTPFDLIVCNPPYILPKEKADLAAQVKNYEPGQALFCEDISKMYTKIRDCAEENLAPRRDLYLEINDSYAQQILSIFNHKKWDTTLMKDYNKHPRFIAARHTN